MSPAIKAASRHWISGTLLALAGVAISRLLAPGFEERVRAWLMAGGQFVALSGLFIILMGIRRRLRLANAEAPPSTS
jgi:hypothetical protein